jgi:hypothetical protein
MCVLNDEEKGRLKFSSFMYQLIPNIGIYLKNIDTN